MKLYICTTYYHVYITLLKQFVGRHSADIVICDDLATGKRLSEKIREKHLFRNVWFVATKSMHDMRKHNFVDDILFQHSRRFSTLRSLLPFDVDDYDDIYIYHDGTPLGKYLNDAKKPYNLVEDSLNFYQRVRETAQAKLYKPHDFKYYVRKLFGAGYFPLGESRYVLDIEVNENRALQIDGKSIVECPREPMEKRLSAKEKKLLMDIFEPGPIEGIKQPAALLMTEPLVIDGVCDSHDEQHAIYRNIVGELKSEGFNVVIKPHPRDDSDYSAYDAVVLERYFPIELMRNMTMFECVITISSTALFSVKGADRYCVWRNNKIETITDHNDSGYC